MSTHLQIRVVEALLPPQLLQQISSPPLTWMAEETHEKRMVAVATLVVKLILETVKTSEKLQIKNLDANPGDRGCQLRAVILREILPHVTDEIAQLKEKMTPLERLLQIRKNGGKSHPETSFQFFTKHLEPLEVSKEMLYLLHCRLMTVVKIVDHVEENGIIVTKTSADALTRLSPQITLVENEIRRQIVSDAAAKLSADSLRLLQEEGRKMQVPQLLQRMLGVVRHNQTDGPYKPKSFGCQFHELQMVLMKLRQQEALIAFKTVVKVGKPQLLFLKPSGPGKEFSIVDIARTPKETLINVFEGVIGLPLELLAKKVEEIGFSKLMLVCVAQEEPFEHGSTLASVTDPEALAEILSYQKMAPELGCVKGQNPLVLMDHVFCSSLREEVKP